MAKLFKTHPGGSHANQLARGLVGEALAVTGKSESFSVHKNGLLDYRWHKLMAKSGCFLTLEFGTYGSDSLFHHLLNEHIYWRNTPPRHKEDVEYLKQREAMLNHFFPRDPLWQQSVLFKSTQCVQKLVKHYS